MAAGLSVIYTPHATLLHHELASRAGIEDIFDAARFDGAWRQRFLRGDPYHGQRLLPDADHYAPEPEPVAHIHVGPAGPRFVRDQIDPCRQARPYRRFPHRHPGLARAEAAISAGPPQPALSARHGAALAAREPLH